MKKMLAFSLAFLSLLFCGCGKSKAVTLAEEKIAAIGVVSLESGDAIKAAEDAIDKLSARQLKQVENAVALTEARTELDRLQRLETLRQNILGSWVIRIPLSVIAPYFDDVAEMGQYFQLMDLECTLDFRANDICWFHITDQQIDSMFNNIKDIVYYQLMQELSSTGKTDSEFYLASNIMMDYFDMAKPAIVSWFKSAQFYGKYTVEEDRLLFFDITDGETSFEGEALSVTITMNGDTLTFSDDSFNTFEEIGPVTLQRAKS